MHKLLDNKSQGAGAIVQLVVLLALGVIVFLIAR